MVKENLAKNIKKYRNNKGWTQEQLSQNLGVSVKYLQRLESKNPPNVTLKTLEKLSKVFKVPADLLIKK